MLTLVHPDTGGPCSEPPSQAAALAFNVLFMATARLPSSQEVAALVGVADAAVSRELSAISPYNTLNTPFTPAEVEVRLSLLQGRKALDLDGLPLELVKYSGAGGGVSRHGHV